MAIQSASLSISLYVRKILRHWLVLLFGVFGASPWWVRASLSPHLQSRFDSFLNPTAGRTLAEVILILAFIIANYFAVAEEYELRHRAEMRSQPALAGRTLLNIKPKSLSALFSWRRTDVEANRLLEPYKGKRLIVSGHLHDVFVSSEKSAHASIMPYLGVLGLFFAPRITMSFRGKEWLDHLSIMKPGEEIRVIGQIARADRMSLSLDNCELFDL